MKRSPSIRYGFSAGAKVIRYSVNIALYGWFNEGFFEQWELRAGKLLFGGHSSKLLRLVPYAQMPNA